MGFTADVGLCFLGVKVDQRHILLFSEYNKGLFKINVLASKETKSGEPQVNISVP